MDRLTMAHVGFDGGGLSVGDRVELHPGLDLWMRGARFGDLRGITKAGTCTVKLDHVARVVRLPAARIRVAIV